MSSRNLNFLFRPKSVAVIGASNKAGSLGAILMRNLLVGGFDGPIMPVNPKHESVAGVVAYKDVRGLPLTPDLALIATPPDTIPGIIDALGKRGTKAAAVLSAVLGAGGDSVQDKMISAAKPYLMRILGPNCVGLIIPGIGFNGSFAHTSTLPGKSALVTQSGAIVTAMLDWAKSRSIGFSHFISLGNSTDVDFGDTLDYLGSDPGTQSILLYIESVRHARKFMSAARAAARNKPVVVVKAGRSVDGARAAFSHTGAMAGSDDVYDAAIRRAGMLRVAEIEDLYDAVENLAGSKDFNDDHLTIMTNGGGPGVMAADALTLAGGRLAVLSEETTHHLDLLLPLSWSKGNPVDIIGDAEVERYVETLKVLLSDRACESILFIHAPTAVVPSQRIAEALAPIIRDSSRNVLSCWLGADGVAEAKRIFTDNHIPVYDTPEAGVRAFMHMVDYKQNQLLLIETPASSLEIIAETSDVNDIVATALEEGREHLSEPETKAVLAAYGIPVVVTQIATSAKEAASVACKIGFPVAVKIVSADISHKSDVGGVVLDLSTPDEVRNAASAMVERITLKMPKSRIQGFSVQQMIRKPGGYELILGAATDSVFGPIILFGQGGTAVEVVGDRAVGLPPLNMKLARELVARTRISKLLSGYRNRPAVASDEIYHALIQISKLVADVPEISELDINPLLVDENGVVALDARIRLIRTQKKDTCRFAIRPYPRELEETVDFDARQILLRPIRPEDEASHRELLSKLSSEDRHMRFFSQVRVFCHSQMARFTQIDYDREMAFIADARGKDGNPETLGVVRIAADPDNVRAEFAIVVRSDMLGLGLGRILADKMIRYCRERGLKEIVGSVLRENKRMLSLADKLGFVRVWETVDDTYAIRLNLVALQVFTDG